MRILFIGNGLTTRVHPNHGNHTELVGLTNEVGCFGEHFVFVFAPNVDGVANTDHVDAVVNKGHDIVHVPKRLADGVALCGFDQMGFGIQLDEVRNLWIVSGILCNQAALTCKNTNGAVGMGSCSNFKQMTRVVGRKRDGLATVVEVVVQVLNFLVASEEVHGTGAGRGSTHVVKVRLIQFVRNIGWNVDVTHGYHVVNHSPVKLATRFST